jgi:hypothetical protein
VELVDQLLAILAGPNPEFASQQLRADRYSEDEIRGAWNYARAAGYTESTTLGMDRLTPAGRARAATIKSAD